MGKTVILEVGTKHGDFGERRPTTGSITISDTESSRYIMRYPKQMGASSLINIIQRIQEFAMAITPMLNNNSLVVELLQTSWVDALYFSINGETTCLRKDTPASHKEQWEISLMKGG